MFLASPSTLWEFVEHSPKALLQAASNPFEQSTHGSLSAPHFIWLSAAVLIIVTLGVACRLLLWQRRLKAALRRAVERLRKLRVEMPTIAGQGAPAGAFESARQALAEFGDVWRDYSTQLVLRTSENGAEQFWATDSAKTAVTGATTTGSRLNVGFYTGFPALLTACGLCLTFMAILVALMHVRVIGNGDVTGVADLISGLSGKFLSSVVALFLAILFGLAEKHIFHDVEGQRIALGAALDSLFPVLRATHILSRLERQSAEQADAFRHFNSDLSMRLKESFSESLGPTLQRMVETNERLAEHLRNSESAKSETIVQALESTIRSLSESISTSLQAMIGDFTRSLSGSANTQLGDLALSLRHSAELIAQLGGTLAGAREGIADIVRAVHEAAQKQASDGQRQIEEMNLAVAGLMRGLADATEELSRKLAESAEQGSMRTTTAIDAVVQRTDEWSGRTAHALQALLDRLFAGAERVKQLEESLVTGIELLNESVEKYRTLNASLQATAERSASMAEAATRAAHSASEGQSALREVAVRAAAQVAELAKTNDQQRDVWKEIASRMQQYTTLFRETEQHAAALLSQISKAATDNAEAAKARFDDTTGAFDKYFSQAIQKLGGAVEELGEALEDLSERVSPRGDAARGGR